MKKLCLRIIVVLLLILMITSFVSVAAPAAPSPSPTTMGVNSTTKSNNDSTTTIQTTAEAPTVSTEMTNGNVFQVADKFAFRFSIRSKQPDLFEIAQFKSGQSEISLFVKRWNKFYFLVYKSEKMNQPNELFITDKDGSFLCEFSDLDKMVNMVKIIDDNSKTVIAMLPNPFNLSKKVEIFKLDTAAKMFADDKLVIVTQTTLSETGANDSIDTTAPDNGNQDDTGNPGIFERIKLLLKNNVVYILLSGVILPLIVVVIMLLIKKHKEKNEEQLDPKRKNFGNDNGKNFSKKSDFQQQEKIIGKDDIRPYTVSYTSGSAISSAAAQPQKLINPNEIKVARAKEIIDTMKKCYDHSARIEQTGLKYNLVGATNVADLVLEEKDMVLGESVSPNKQYFLIVDDELLFINPEMCSGANFRIHEFMSKNNILGKAFTLRNQYTACEFKNNVNATIKSITPAIVQQKRFDFVVKKKGEIEIF